MTYQLDTIPTARTCWVDSITGDDVTGEKGNAKQQFQTIAAALAVAVAGDVVLVRPGAYAESSLTLPPSVTLRSDGGWNATEIGDVAAVSDILTISDQSQVDDLTFLVPATAGVRGISYTGGGDPTASIYNCVFKGDGAAGQGTGIYKTGAGKIVGGNIRLDLGGVANLLHVDSGALALDDVHVPGSPGGVSNVILADGTGRFQGQGINIGNPNIVDCIHVAGTATCIIYSPNWFNVPIGGHIAADGVSVTIVGGRIDTTVASLLVDGGLTGVGTTVTVSGTTIQPLFSFPAAAITAMELNATFLQEQTLTRNSESRVVGTELVTGFPELGSGSAIGEGSPYSDGQVVKTTDATAGPGSDGGAFLDVSVAAQSRDLSTFGFQGVGAGHSILWCTSRTDGAGVPLKHWGVELDQVVAAVLGAGSFVFEVQTAVNTWVEVDVMAVSPAEQYVYADQVFLRAASEETLRLGLDSTTPWAPTTIDGTLGHWLRVRIASTVTTGPVFERQRLIPSHIATNERGQLGARGLSQWRSQLFGVGNVWGEVTGGGTKDADIAVGSGGVPTGWNQKIKKGLMNSNGDSISFQLQIPDGICTAFPLNFTLNYSLVGVSPVTVAPSVVLSVLLLGVGGVLIADSAGGVAPVPRADTAAEAFTSKAATALAVSTGTGAITDRQLSAAFGPYSIQEFYQGDAVVLRLELDSEGTPAQDLAVWTVSVDGVRFTPGGRL